MLSRSSGVASSSLSTIQNFTMTSTDLRTTNKTKSLSCKCPSKASHHSFRMLRNKKLPCSTIIKITSVVSTTRPSQKISRRERDSALKRWQCVMNLTRNRLIYLSIGSRFSKSSGITSNCKLYQLVPHSLKRRRSQRRSARKSLRKTLTRSISTESWLP